MKPMICFLLLALGACGGQQKTGTPLAAYDTGKGTGQRTDNLGA